jgi:hypothetical protein
MKAIDAVANLRKLADVLASDYEYVEGPNA